MTYEPLRVFCGCGYPADSIAEVGLTPEHQFVIHWRCPACDEAVYIFKDLADCWRECPSRSAPLSVAEPLADSSELQEADLAFLNSMGIGLPD